MSSATLASSKSPTASSAAAQRAAPLSVTNTVITTPGWLSRRALRPFSVRVQTPPDTGCISPRSFPRCWAHRIERAKVLIVPALSRVSVAVRTAAGTAVRSATAA